MKFKFIIFAILLTSCSDEIYNTYISSAYAPNSSASSVSSASSTPAPISQSASSYQSSYTPADMLISFAGHTLAARWSGSTFDFKVISSNRLIIQSGCKYSITGNRRNNHRPRNRRILGQRNPRFNRNRRHRVLSLRKLDSRHWPKIALRNSTKGAGACYC